MNQTCGSTLVLGALPTSHVRCYRGKLTARSGQQGHVDQSMANIDRVLRSGLLTGLPPLTGAAARLILIAEPALEEIGLFTTGS
jgi:hypothetical protein